MQDIYLFLVLESKSFINATIPKPPKLLDQQKTDGPQSRSRSRSRSEGAELKSERVTPKSQANPRSRSVSTDRRPSTDESPGTHEKDEHGSTSNVDLIDAEPKPPTTIHSLSLDKSSSLRDRIRKGTQGTHAKSALFLFFLESKSFIYATIPKPIIPEQRKTDGPPSHSRSRSRSEDAELKSERRKSLETQAKPRSRSVSTEQQSLKGEFHREPKIDEQSSPGNLDLVIDVNNPRFYLFRNELLKAHALYHPSPVA